MSDLATTTPSMARRRRMARRPRRPGTWVSLAVVAILSIAACGPAAAMPPSGPEASDASVAAAPAAPSPTPIPTPTPTPAPTATPTPTPAPTTATPAPTAEPEVEEANPEIAEAEPKPFAMNLYRKGDFVAQYTFEWCVGASIQMAYNLATDERRSSKTDQGRLWAMARDRSSSPFGGANPRGWTAVLNELGIGPYKLVSLPTFEEALDTAAKAIRSTRRPVGLVMWRGRHAWVMSGFEATADPRRHDDFRVTGIRVLDPLYPHGSSVWGKSPRPNSLVSRRTLAKQFVFRDSRRVDLGVPPGYVLILPVKTEA